MIKALFVIGYISRMYNFGAAENVKSEVVPVFRRFARKLLGQFRYDE